MILQKLCGAQGVWYPLSVALTVLAPAAALYCCHVVLCAKRPEKGRSKKRR